MRHIYRDQHSARVRLGPLFFSFSVPPRGDPTLDLADDRLRWRGRAYSNGDHPVSLMRLYTQPYSLILQATLVITTNLSRVDL